MKDINLLEEKLRLLLTGEDRALAFKTVLKEVADYYKDNLDLQTDEVAVLLLDRSKSVLSFAYPDFLIDSGLLPISSPDAFASLVYRSGKGAIENVFNQQKHLRLFEYVKNPDNTRKPICKIMAAVLAVGDEKIGIIELSRKGHFPHEAGDDFSQENLVFLEKSVLRLSPYIKQVMPDDYKGKIL